ncbi:MAG: hypothetical protein L6U99_11420 [Clostridium sp.]|nr:MAG: hypothetical protein L6U99_11420 [Clostridium sp.]
MNRLRIILILFSNYKPLDDLERKTIDEALSLFLKKTKIIPCTGCRYCMDCPFWC